MLDKYFNENHAKKKVKQKSIAVENNFWHAAKVHLGDLASWSDVLSGKYIEF